MRSPALLTLVALTLLQVSLGQAEYPNIAQILRRARDYKILVTALTAADLIAPLEGPGRFTVFAPSDAAFAVLPPGAIDDLLKPENKPKLIQILSYHILGDEVVTTTDMLRVPPPFKLEMLNGISTTITAPDTRLLINNASMVFPNVLAINGMIHGIDAILFPPDIVDIAINDGRFKTLVTALTAADLVDVLRDPGPFTVFAPTDDAFAKLPPGTVDDLLKPENKPKLIKILTYHVVGGRALTAADILALKPPFKLEMLNGLATSITAPGDKIKINDATVIVADVIASNGVVHAIDTVLLP